jgi:cytochrome c-type biogenesis protein
MFVETVSYPAAFIAGLLSFFAPCIVPLIPAYFTFISGYSLEELTGKPDTAVRSKVLLATLAFVCGFSCVFILLGASASFLGGYVQSHSNIIRIVGGVFIIVLGLHLTGWLRIKKLDVEKRIHMTQKPIHFLGTFLVGMAFGAGWSPCIGPLLGSILIIAGNQDTVWQGVRLLAVYSAGLAIPFVIVSIFINFILVWLKSASRALKYANLTAGILLIVMGIGLIANKFTL